MQTKEKNMFDTQSFFEAGVLREGGEQDRHEVGEERYWEMLEVLPPERMVANAFLVGEPVDHDRWGSPRFDLYFKAFGRFYYGGICTTADFDSKLV